MLVSPAEFSPVDNSSNRGYLQETLADSIIDVQNLWHDVLTGLTGFDENLVRLAEQVDPPPTPGREVDWLAFKIAPGEPARNFPDVAHVSDDEGHDLVIEYKPEDVFIYAFGPLSSDTVDKIRRALHIEQNRDVLYLSGIGIVQVGAPRQVPTLQNQKWYQRHDIVINTLRETIGRYEVLNLLESSGTVYTDNINSAGENVSADFDTDNILKLVVNK